MSAKVYKDADANLDILKGKKVAIIGYGNQGRAQALNLRDSGVDVIVSNREGSRNYNIAVQDGFKPMTAAEATKQADVIQILTPDETMPQVYRDEIEPNLTAGKALMFSHGFNIHFNQIVPPTDVDVILSL
jgi:ketol-acid reductoisomerase